MPCRKYEERIRLLLTAYVIEALGLNSSLMTLETVAHELGEIDFARLIRTVNNKRKCAQPDQSGRF